MRRISNPDAYVSAKSAAAMLREIASTIEKKESMLTVYVQVTSATPGEVAAARERIARRAAREARP